jgi:hypothetical protein
VILLQMGQSYIRSDAPAHARTAFGRACSELRQCLSMDPANQRIQQMLKKCELVRAEYENTEPQGVR